MSGEAEITVVPKKIGGSIALFLPSEVVRRRRIREGIPVRISIGPERRAHALGALRRRGRHREFDRHSEGFWPDD